MAVVNSYIKNEGIMLANFMELLQPSYYEKAVDFL